MPYLLIFQGLLIMRTPHIDTKRQIKRIERINKLNTETQRHGEKNEGGRMMDENGLED